MPEEYILKQGDCISSIAYERGFFWETLWNHSRNSELKTRRKDPNVLMAGDSLFIPDLAVGEEAGATEGRHRFKLKGVPAKLRLRLIKNKPPEPVPEADADDATDADLAAGSAEEAEKPPEVVPQA